MRLRSISLDGGIRIELLTELELHPSGVVRLRASAGNPGEPGYQLTALERHFTFRRLRATCWR